MVFFTIQNKPSKTIMPLCNLPICIDSIELKVRNRQKVQFISLINHKRPLSDQHSSNYMSQEWIKRNNN